MIALELKEKLQMYDRYLSDFFKNMFYYGHFQTYIKVDNQCLQHVPCPRLKSYQCTSNFVLFICLTMPHPTGLC